MKRMKTNLRRPQLNPAFKRFQFLPHPAVAIPAHACAAPAADDCLRIQDARCRGSGDRYCEFERGARPGKLESERFRQDT
jgi:hypothetical protein